MTEFVWKPLAEIELNFFKLKHLRTHCLCSCAFIRDNIRVRKWERIFNDKCNQFEINDESETTAFVAYEFSEHNTESKSIKEQEVEAVSCYASHYSTDDYESVVQSTSAPISLFCNE